jgi:CBS-domain-containing membrane protein
MRVENLMSRQIATCTPQDSLEHAARLMWDHDCGFLPVCTTNGSSRLLGVITDRDICMCALFQGKALHELQFDAAMAREVLTCKPHDSLIDAEAKMSEEQIRRLPVVSDDGTLLGIVSMADLAREAARQQNSPGRKIASSEVATTLAAICAPSANHLAA